MNILVLGNATDPHAAHLYAALTQVGVAVEYWDTRLFPTQSQVSWSPHNQSGELTFPTGEKLSLQAIHSVFWRHFSGASIPVLADPDQERIALNDAMSTLRSLLQIDSVHWVNSWQAYQFHKEKPRQLSKIAKLGVSIPATLITNNSADVDAFIQTHSRAIYKPVYGGAHTQLIEEIHLEPKRLELALKISPITLQEYIPGTNIRSYVIGNSVYSAEIRSHCLDFREDADAKLIPIQLPESIQQQCIEIAMELMLEWTAIDWRLTPTGEYVFLEANPSPMFLHFERQTGFPITQQLVKLLMS
jgi:glutathione synthase/RimK-type ligase-like ATP-grasp enzyme